MLSASLNYLEAAGSYDTVGQLTNFPFLPLVVPGRILTVCDSPSLARHDSRPVTCGVSLNPDNTQHYCPCSTECEMAGGLLAQFQGLALR